jgi:Domain of unknown function (DUF4337)
MSHGHGAGHSADGDGNKKIAIFISIIALFLAIAETFAKSAQTNQISYNVEASNLWSFMQAKTIRQTTLRTAAEQMSIDVALAKDPVVKTALEKRVNTWLETANRYQSEPGIDKKTGEKIIDPKTGLNKGEGRDELFARAVAMEKLRDVAADKYHLFEIASAMFQIALVLTSVYLLTHAALMLWTSFGLCGLAFALMGAGFLKPDIIHLVH